MINPLNNERAVFKVRYPPKTISKLVAFNMNLLGIEFIDAMLIKLVRKAITEECEAILEIPHVGIAMSLF